MKLLFTTLLLLSIGSFHAQSYDIGDYLNLEEIEELKKGIALYEDSLAQMYHALGLLHFYDNDMELALHFTQKEMDVLSPDSIADIANALYNTGYFYKCLQEDVSAENHFLQSENLYKKAGDKSRVLSCKKQIGNLYGERGDYEQAGLLLDHVLKNGGTDMLNVVIDLSYYLNRQGRFSKSVELLLEYRDSLDPENQIYANINLAHAYDGLHRYPKAIETNQEILRLCANDPYYFEERITATNNISVSLKKLGKYDQALDSLQQLLLQIGEDHPSLAAPIHNNLGDVYDLLGNTAKASNSYHRSLQQYLPERVPFNPAHLPSWDYLVRSQQKNSTTDVATIPKYFPALPQPHLSNATTLPEWDRIVHSDNKEKIFNLVKDKANFLKKQGYTTGNDHHQAALDHYLLADKIVDQMRRDHAAMKSKLFWRKEVKPMYDQAIALCFDQHQYDQAFRFMEKSKNLIALEARQHLKAKKSGVPDSLLARERQLQKQIASTSDNGQLVDLNRQYKQLIDTFENAFPRYYQIKYKVHFAGIDDIQRKLLDQSKCMVEYFVGEDYIYLFLITHNKMFPKKLEKDFPLEKWVAQLKSSMRVDGTGYDKRVDSLAWVSHQLYQKLLGPVEKDLKEHLIVVADDVLGYIPFEALLYKEAPQSGLFKDQSYPFLIKKNRISYGFSATLLCQGKTSSPAYETASFLAMAPDFPERVIVTHPITGKKIELDPLYKNKDEAAAIADLLNGELRLDTTASIQQLEAMGSSFNTLFLSTHGVATDDPDHSFLVFQREDGSYELLLVKDLYNMDFSQVRLVFFKACNTGDGIVYEGEGIGSLGRAFLYGGAQSLVMTLWNLMENESSPIVLSFYKYLHQGHSNHEALHLAKLDYLTNSDTKVEAHPFYWAAFVTVGHTAPMYEKGLAFGLPHGWYLLLLPLMLVLGYGLYRRIQHNMPWTLQSALE